MNSTAEQLKLHVSELLLKKPCSMLIRCSHVHVLYMYVVYNVLPVYHFPSLYYVRVYTHTHTHIRSHLQYNVL